MQQNFPGSYLDASLVPEEACLTHIETPSRNVRCQMPPGPMDMHILFIPSWVILRNPLHSSDGPRGWTASYHPLWPPQKFLLGLVPPASPWTMRVVLHILSLGLVPPVKAWLHPHALVSEKETQAKLPFRILQHLCSLRCDGFLLRYAQSWAPLRKSMPTEDGHQDSERIVSKTCYSASVGLEGRGENSGVYLASTSPNP